MSGSELEDVWRREVPHVLGALARRYGHFDLCEDAVQEALLAAAHSWTAEGLPANPRAWLVQVAARRLIDALRAESSRRQRELADGVRRAADSWQAPTADVDPLRDGDDTLQLLLLCCDPVLTPPSQVALTLRAVGGLTTAQIAAAFLVPEATMAQRISRAKSALRKAGVRFDQLPADRLDDRLAAVLHVLYLIFNEGYTSSGGKRLLDTSLTSEALRLARELHRRLPHHDEVAGLLALMLLTDARRPARTDADGDLVPLAEQDRATWGQQEIREGVALVERLLARGEVGPFQLQAAIAAVHAEAPTWRDTDWLQITMLYRMLDGIAPSMAVSLNLAVAVGMAHGPEAGLALVQRLLTQPEGERQHRVHAVSAHLLEMARRPAEALAAYQTAARLTTSVPEQRYLNARAARLTGDPHCPSG